MVSFWSKRINAKQKQQVAKDLGIEEEKVQELIDGKRHIGGETMDKVLQSIKEEKENRIAKELEITSWYAETDLKKLRKDWGYGQSELANKLGMNPKTFNSIENKYQFVGHASKTFVNYMNFIKMNLIKKYQSL